MNPVQLLYTCFRSILRNRMRSLLTSLGVIIGVGSVIIMVAMGEGSQRAIEAQMTAMGTNLLQVQYRRPSSRSGQQIYVRRNAFTKNDLDKLRYESSFAVAVSGLVQTNNVAVFGNEGNTQVTVQGVEPDYALARNWKVNAGTFFDEDDLMLRNSVAVLGRTTAKNLFGETDSALSGQIR